MKTLTYILLIIFVGILLPTNICAQTKDRGRLSGSLESSLGFYFDDKELSSAEKTESFGTNTFVNLGYEIGCFRFGLEYDVFEPPMIGTSRMLEGNKLMQGFASYSAPRWEIRLGTTFEQLGAGLLFRAYEDRNLALNTSLMGGSVQWRPVDWVALKAFAGVPKKFLKYAESTVYGADVEFFLHECFFKASDATLILGGSWLLREDRNDLEYKVAPQTVRGFSGRCQFSKSVFSFGGEYVMKSTQQVLHPLYGALARKGNALLLNGSVDYAGFGFSMEYRALRFMEFNIDDVFSDEFLMLNYLPALTQQHKYALMGLYPHKLVGAGERGGQFDFFGTIPCGEAEPVDFSLNGSMYHGLKEKEQQGEYYFLKSGGKLLFAEMSCELHRKWGKNFKTILAASWQKKEEFSRLGFGDMLMNSEVVVVDGLYKFNRKTSLRMEFSHAWSDSKDDKAWMYALAELGFSPKWTFHVSDMYNYETAGKRLHYYSMGGSFTWETLRASLVYGRNRAGMQCSGGVCRYIPEHNGMTLNLSVRF